MDVRLLISLLEFRSCLAIRCLSYQTSLLMVILLLTTLFNI